MIQKSPNKLDFVLHLLVSAVVICLSEESFLGWKGQTKVGYLLQRKYVLFMVPVETISLCMEISWKLSLPAPLPATALGNFFFNIKSKDLEDFEKTAFFGSWWHHVSVCSFLGQISEY